VRGLEGHLRKVGRGLADNHPEATRPEEWTPQIAAHFVKAATEMTTDRRSVWMKLVWTSLNLTDSDCQYLSRWYPSDLIRAAAVLWAHAGLRSDELRRIEVGCIRDLTPGLDAELEQEIERDIADIVCLLSVPVNKTSRAYTKPVGKAVARCVAA
jgi:hypothetical protein